MKRYLSNLKIFGVCLLIAVVINGPSFYRTFNPMPTPEPDTLPTVAEMAVTRAYKVETMFGSGSGVCIAKGFMLTAHHVIFGKNKVQVTVGGTVYDVESWETIEGMDAVILKVDTPACPVTLRVVPLIVGDIVFIVGYPWGSGPIITTGIMSGRWNELLLLDAGARAGNSGGPVFDSNGELVGIVIMATGGIGRSSTIMTPIYNIMKEWHGGQL